MNDEIKKPHQRTDADLLELVCQLHSRSLAVQSESMHNAYVEARQELDKRLLTYAETISAYRTAHMEMEEALKISRSESLDRFNSLANSTETLRSFLLRLRGSGDHGCWCEVRIGNPMMHGEHSGLCKEIREAMGEA